MAITKTPDPVVDKTQPLNQDPTKLAELAAAAAAEAAKNPPGAVIEAKDPDIVAAGAGRVVTKTPDAVVAAMLAGPVKKMPLETARVVAAEDFTIELPNGAVIFYRRGEDVAPQHAHMHGVPRHTQRRPFTMAHPGPRAAPNMPLGMAAPEPVAAAGKH